MESQYFVNHPELDGDKREHTVAVLSSAIVKAHLWVKVGSGEPVDLLAAGKNAPVIGETHTGHPIIQPTVLPSDNVVFNLHVPRDFKLEVKVQGLSDKIPPPQFTWDLPIDEFGRAPEDAQMCHQTCWVAIGSKALLFQAFVGTVDDNVHAAIPKHDVLPQFSPYKLYNRSWPAVDWYRMDPVDNDKSRRAADTLSLERGKMDLVFGMGGGNMRDAPYMNTGKGRISNYRTPLEYVLDKDVAPPDEFDYPFPGEAQAAAMSGGGQKNFWSTIASPFVHVGEAIANLPGVTQQWWHNTVSQTPNTWQKSNDFVGATDNQPAGNNVFIMGDWEWDEETDTWTSSSEWVSASMPRPQHFTDFDHDLERVVMCRINLDWPLSAGEEAEVMDEAVKAYLQAYRKFLHGWSHSAERYHEFDSAVSGPSSNTFVSNEDMWNKIHDAWFGGLKTTKFRRPTSYVSVNAPVLLRVAPHHGEVKFGNSSFPGNSAPLSVVTEPYRQLVSVDTSHFKGRGLGVLWRLEPDDGSEALQEFDPLPWVVSTRVNQSEPWRTFYVPPDDPDGIHGGRDGKTRSSLRHMIDGAWVGKSGKLTVWLCQRSDLARLPGYPQLYMASQKQEYDIEIEGTPDDQPTMEFFDSDSIWRELKQDMIVDYRGPSLQLRVQPKGGWKPDNNARRRYVIEPIIGKEGDSVFTLDQPREVHYVQNITYALGHVAVPTGTQQFEFQPKTSTTVAITETGGFPAMTLHADDMDWTSSTSTGVTVETVTLTSEENVAGVDVAGALRDVYVTGFKCTETNNNTMQIVRGLRVVSVTSPDVAEPSNPKWVHAPGKAYGFTVSLSEGNYEGARMPLLPGDYISFRGGPDWAETIAVCDWEVDGRTTYRIASEGSPAGNNTYKVVLRTANDVAAFSNTHGTLKVFWADTDHHRATDWYTVATFSLRSRTDPPASTHGLYNF